LQTVGRFAKTIVDSMDWLVTNGHPRWKAVDINYPLKGWEQYDIYGSISAGPWSRRWQ
jgi:uncharacterized protein